MRLSYQLARLLLGFSWLLMTRFTHAQFFNQDFNLSNTVADYVSNNPNVRQFNAISANRASLAIDNGGLRITRSQNGQSIEALLVRSTNIQGAPTGGLPTLMVRFNITALTLSSVAANASNTDFLRVQVGSGFNNTVAVTPNANVYAQFMLYAGTTANNFRVGTVSAPNATNYAPGANETRRITFTMNNSGGTITYRAPNGSMETLANDTWDLWVGTNRELNDQPVTTPSGNIEDFKFFINASPSLGNAANNPTIVLDDISVFPLGDMPAATYGVGTATNNPGNSLADNYPFTSLTRNAGGFFEVLNYRAGVAGPVNFDIHADISIENGLNPLLELANTSATNQVRIRPNTTTARTISGSVNNNALIRLSGADHVVFDGLNSNRLLTLSHPSTSWPTVQFLNGATFNEIRHCNLLGSSLSNTAGQRGVVSFFTSNATVGNNQNLIAHSHITQATPGRPFIGIDSQGSPDQPNLQNTIEQCDIYGFRFNDGNTRLGRGISLRANNSEWQLSNNSFYLSEAQLVGSGNTTVDGAIVVENSGTGYLIEGNYIGGTAPMASGTPMVFQEVSGQGFFRVNGFIWLNGPSGTVKDNVIGNIRFRGVAAGDNCGSDYAFRGIQVQGNGILSITDNLIENIEILNLTNEFYRGYQAIGINLFTNSSSVIEGNTIRNIFSNDPALQNRSVDLIGIFVGANSPTITNNTISGLVNNNGTAVTDGCGQAKSGTRGSRIFGIQNVSIGTPLIANNLIEQINSPVEILVGIENRGNALVQGNRVQDLTYTHGSLSPAALFAGIFHTGSAPAEFSGNTIANLASSALWAGALNQVAVAGFAAIGDGNYQFRQNTIHSLGVSHANNGAHAAGIFLHSGAAGVIDGNKIYNITTNTGSASYAAGLLVRDFSSSLVLQNNMVSLGITPLGAANALDMNLVGIYHNFSSSSLLYAVYNTLHIGGTGAIPGSNSSYCFYRGDNSTSRVFLYNNLMQNVRFVASGGQLHIPIRTDVTTNWQATFQDCELIDRPFVNYNAYFTSNNGIVAFFNNTTLNFANWQAASGSDLHSIDLGASGNEVEFVNVALANLRLALTSEVRLNGKAYPLLENLPTIPQNTLPTVTNDIDDESRIGPDIGADEVIFEFTGVAGTGLWSEPATWLPSGVPSFGDIVRIPSGSKVTVPAGSQHHFYQLEVEGELEMLANAELYGAFSDAFGGNAVLGGTISADPTATMGFASSITKATAGPVEGTVLLNIDDIPSPFPCFLSNYIRLLNEQTANLVISGNLNTDYVRNLKVLNQGEVALEKNLLVGNPVSAMGVLDIGTGEFILNGFQLTLNGDLAETSGTLQGSPTSRLVIAGQGNLTGTLKFTNGFRELQSLQINRTGSGPFNKARVTLGNTLNISGTLVLQEGLLLTTNSFEVYVNTPSPAAVTAANGHVVGFLRRDVALGTYQFPVGSLINRNQATVSFTNLQGLGNVQASFDPDFAGLSFTPVTDADNVIYENACSGGLWTLVPNVPVQAVYDLELENTGISCVGSAQTVAKLVNSQTSVDFAGSAPVTATRRNGFTGFTEFVIISEFRLLPVNFLRFTARQQGPAINVMWETANERGIAHYLVERSANGRDFMALGTLEARNIQAVQQYQFQDLTWPSAGSTNTLYYRLRYLDEGVYQLSRVIEVPIAPVAKGLTAYPNPTREALFIDWGNTQYEQVSLRLVDLQGKVLYQARLTNPQGDYQLETFEQLPQGMYVLVVVTPLGRETMKIVKE